MKLIQYFLFAMCFSVSAAPTWVDQSINNLRSGDPSVQRKAASRLSSYFTDNGSESDPKIIDSNLDLFFEALANPITARSFTEIFGSRYISTEDGEYFLYLDRVSPEIKARFIEQILRNLQSKDRRLAEESADALINLTKCKYESEIKKREKEGKKEGKSEFAFESVLKSLAAKCGQKP